MEKSELTFMGLPAIAWRRAIEMHLGNPRFLDIQNLVMYDHKMGKKAANEYHIAWEYLNCLLRHQAEFDDSDYIKFHKEELKNL